MQENTPSVIRRAAGGREDATESPEEGRAGGQGRVFTTFRVRAGLGAGAALQEGEAWSAQLTERWCWDRSWELEVESQEGTPARQAGGGP